MCPLRQTNQKREFWGEKAGWQTKGRMYRKHTITFFQSLSAAKFIIGTTILSCCCSHSLFCVFTGFFHAPGHMALRTKWQALQLLTVEFTEAWGRWPPGATSEFLLMWNVTTVSHFIFPPLCLSFPICKYCPANLIIRHGWAVWEVFSTSRPSAWFNRDLDRELGRHDSHSPSAGLGLLIQWQPHPHPLTLHMSSGDSQEWLWCLQSLELPEQPWAISAD